MDPLSVLKTLVKHKWVALPVVVMTLLAGTYVMIFAQRTYEAAMTYALITPKVPSASELQSNPNLASINGDNPYLRSPDTSLLSQVLITKLAGQKTADGLRKQGLGTEYTVAQASNLGSGMLLQLSASGNSPEQAVATVQELSHELTSTLYNIQKVNGADDSYLFSAVPVDGPGEAKEIFSSRLRTLIIVLVGGACLVFGAVSVARSVELARERKTEVRSRPSAARRPASDAAKSSAVSQKNEDGLDQPREWDDMDFGTSAPAPDRPERALTRPTQQSGRTAR